jgi:hypothetical protein
VIPGVAYTHPEVAWVGVGEDEAKKAGRKVSVAKFPWAASGRAIANGADYGFTKLVFDEETHRVIGGSIVGPNAGDMIGEVALAIEMGADAVDIGKTIHPHPTLGETIGMAAEVAHGSCTDLPPMRKNVPQQIEFIEGVLRHGGGLELSSQPSAQTSHVIDVGAAAGPQRYQPAPGIGGSLRYCSVARLKAPMMRFAAEYRRPEAAPEWLGQCPASREQVEAAIQVLMAHWGGPPPKRGWARNAQQEPMRVMLGFGLARRMIAAAQFARLGRTLKYEGNDWEAISRQFEATRFGSVNPGSDDRRTN